CHPPPDLPTAQCPKETLTATMAGASLHLERPHLWPPKGRHPLAALQPHRWAQRPAGRHPSVTPRAGRLRPSPGEPRPRHRSPSATWPPVVPKGLLRQELLR
ncbi:unnamed protein product, partial [Cladocopium goreaui]